MRDMNQKLLDLGFVGAEVDLHKTEPNLWECTVKLQDTSLLLLSVCGFGLTPELAVSSAHQEWDNITKNKGDWSNFALPPHGGR